MEPKTLIIRDLGGPLTRRIDGDITSGQARYDTSWGYDPFSNPGNLTWMEQPTSILSISGDLSTIGAMRSRVEGNTGMVYAIAGNKNLYQIQVNNAGSSTANYDNPSVVGALTLATNMTRGAAMVFYGATEKIFYGDDASIQRINFSGVPLGSVIGSSSVVTNVARAMAVFQGKIYFTNGNNIGEIDSTETITTGSKLVIALPIGVMARDLDVTPDGNYLQITATRADPAGGFQSLTSTPAAATQSFKFLWNGVDVSATSFEEYGGLGLTSSAVFGTENYTLGYDPLGAAIFSNSQKIVSLPNVVSPWHGATYAVGNMLGFMAGGSSGGTFRAELFNYGQYDAAFETGLYRPLRQFPTVGTNIAFVNTCINVSNLLYYPTYGGYTNNIASSGKIYFSTIESTTADPTFNLGILWKFTTVPTGVGSVVAGVYETQTQLFSKKVAIKEVRLYTQPLVANNSFTIELIGSGGSVMGSSSQIFTVGTNVTAGDDVVKYNPPVAPTYALGVRVTNSSVLGTKNWVGMKLELDYVQAGK